MSVLSIPVPRKLECAASSSEVQGELPEDAQRLQLKAISQLASPLFFEYTQSARYLIEQGTEVVPLLYANRHLHREVNATFIPVCMLVMQIIFATQSDDWVSSQLQSEFPEIRDIAAAEQERRSKN
jgi:hypothetical protein